MLERVLNGGSVLSLLWTVSCSTICIWTSGFSCKFYFKKLKISSCLDTLAVEMWQIRFPIDIEIPFDDKIGHITNLGEKDHLQDHMWWIYFATKSFTTLPLGLIQVLLFWFGIFLYLVAIWSSTKTGKNISQGK